MTWFPRIAICLLPAFISAHAALADSIIIDLPAGSFEMIQGSLRPAGDGVFKLDGVVRINNGTLRMGSAPRSATAHPSMRSVPKAPASRKDYTMDSLRVAVQRCWVVDLSSEAANVRVTVRIVFDEAGRVSGPIRMIEAEGGPQSAVDTAFQAARRAILRCQGDGYDLPSEKYAQSREIEMTFNPDGMRVR
ncbi:hypothetical protein ACOXXX_20290 [Thalassococcus sp. BH17M4-6]|uniref:hypothetical protein n=1 Tax=Thalassococcus sp. BH17M4-6 TaxID=3413148 RepID=UPI003BC2BFBB